jgi:hypothetical protein
MARQTFLLRNELGLGIPHARSGYVHTEYAIVPTAGPQRSLAIFGHVPGPVDDIREPAFIDPCSAIPARGTDAVGRPHKHALRSLFGLKQKKCRGGLLGACTQDRDKLVPLHFQGASARAYQQLVGSFSSGVLKMVKEKA